MIGGTIEDNFNVWYKHYREPDTDPSEWPQSVVERHGKALACVYLERFGLTIIGQDHTLMQDWKHGWRTIDIVGRDDDGVVVLADVRVSLGDEGDVPELSVSHADMNKMKEKVTRYLEENPDVQVARHDVVSVLIIGKKDARVRHLVSAVEMNRDEL